MELKFEKEIRRQQAVQLVELRDNGYMSDAVIREIVEKDGIVEELEAVRKDKTKN